MFCLTLCQQEALIQLHVYFKICSVVEPKCTILHRRVITVKPLRCIMAVHNNSCHVFQLPIKPWPRTHIIIWCNKAKTTTFYFCCVPALFPLIIQPCMGHKRHKVSLHWQGLINENKGLRKTACGIIVKKRSLFDVKGRTEWLTTRRPGFRC